MLIHYYSYTGVLHAADGANLNLAGSVTPYGCCMAHRMAKHRLERQRIFLCYISWQNYSYPEIRLSAKAIIKALASSFFVYWQKCFIQKWWVPFRSGASKTTNRLWQHLSPWTTRRKLQVFCHETCLVLPSHIFSGAFFYALVIACCLPSQTKASLVANSQHSHDVLTRFEYSNLLCPSQVPSARTPSLTVARRLSTGPRRRHCRGWLASRRKAVQTAPHQQEEETEQLLKQPLQQQQQQPQQEGCPNSTSHPRLCLWFCHQRLPACRCGSVNIRENRPYCSSGIVIYSHKLGPTPWHNPFRPIIIHLTETIGSMCFIGK